MKKLDYVVKVFTKLTETIPAIGMTSGICQWSTADQTIGILSNDWSGKISDSVDVSVSGNYAKYTSCSIEIIRAMQVETTLKNYGSTMIGKLVEIYETDGVKLIILRRGICRDIKLVGNTEKVEIDHLANFYGTNLTPFIGADFQPVVFGSSVASVKLVKEEEKEVPELTIGDDLLPVFVVVANSETLITMRTVYSTSMITSQQMIDFTKSGTCLIVGENKLVGNFVLGYNTITVNSVNYYKIDIKLVPMNMKDSDGNPFFEVDQQVKLERSGYVKIFKPYGVTWDSSKLRFEQNRNLLPFPSYLDSMFDYSDRIEILDADNVGYIFKSNIPNVNSLTIKITIGTLSTIVLPLNDGVNNVSFLGCTLVVTVINKNYINTNDDNYCTITITKENTIYDDITLIDIVSSQTIKFRNNQIPSSVFDTKNFSFDKIINDRGPTEFSLSSTVTTLKTVYDTSYEAWNFSSDRVVFNSLFPNTSISADYSSNYFDNLKFRWENNGKGTGLTYDIFNNAMEDWEKTSKIEVRTVFRWSTHETFYIGKIRIYLKQKLAETCEYDTGDLYLENVSGRKDSTDSTITNTRSAYLSALQLQNYSYFGITEPAEGWGLGYPSQPLTSYIDTAFPMASVPISYVSESSSSQDVKYDMLKYSFACGFIDGKGKENTASVVDFGGGFTFTKDQIIGDIDVQKIDTTRIYPDIRLTWSGGSITVSNTEKDVYNASYVSGVTSSTDSRALWEAGHILFKMYGVKNEYPTKLANIKAFTTEADAITYAKNQYRLAGCIFSTDTIQLKDRNTVSFNVPEEIIFNNEFQIGSKITLVYPNTCPNGWSGYITGISRSPLNFETTITAEVLGDTIALSEKTRILESGNSTTRKIETGSQPDRIFEI